MKYTHRQQFRLLGLVFLLLWGSVGLTACSWLGGTTTEEQTAVVPSTAESVDRYAGEPSEQINYVYTTMRELTLTFSGMGERAQMLQLLDELDRVDVKATFFVPGMRVAEEPDLAREIVARGHEIENNTLARADLTEMDYEEIYHQLRLTNEIIERETGVQPQYVRTRSGSYNDDIRLATAHLGLQAVITYSINLQGWHGEKASTIGDYVKRHITRGGIIALSTEDNPEIIESLGMILGAVDEVGYSLVPLSRLMEYEHKGKPLEEIEGYDAAKINPDYRDTDYELVYKSDRTDKRIALTFDDWGTDYTVTRTLDILKEHGIKSTFFLRANGVEANPNLARAIVEDGHEVANHTYSHPVIVDLTPEELQEEIVKSHQVMTEAIQQQPVMMFRPPTGAFDDESARIVAATGYHTIAMYDVTTLDWDVQNDAEHIVKVILDRTESGSVILLHILDGLHTLEALPIAIKELRSRGFTFVLMSELLGVDQRDE